MITRIGINGFGRIGRLTLRAINQYHAERLSVVAINDLADTKANTHLFKWDSNYGQYPGSVESTEDSIIVDNKEIKTIQECDPAKIPWNEYGTDIVIESTGLFTDATKASVHKEAGVKKIVISAPASNEDITIVLGVNEDKYDPAQHQIISNASCTTNGLVPMVKVLQDKFGIVKGLMTTVHAYTNDQKIMDVYHKDLRRARAAAINIIPTTTGAAFAVSRVLPELEGKLHGISLRVPVPTVSLIDLVVELSREASAEEVNDAFKEASEGSLRGILEYSQENLVSSDFKGKPASCSVDAPSTIVIGQNMVKVLGWYDNEWGYSCRLADLTNFIAEKGF
jgi:glyceraldehyde 3-phosphate dehydrogenase